MESGIDFLVESFVEEFGRIVFLYALLRIFRFVVGAVIECFAFTILFLDCLQLAGYDSGWIVFLHTSELLGALLVVLKLARIILVDL